MSSATTVLSLVVLEEDEDHEDDCFPPFADAAASLFRRLLLLLLLGMMMTTAFEEDGIYSSSCVDAIAFTQASTKSSGVHHREILNLGSVWKVAKASKLKIRFWDLPSNKHLDQKS